MKENVTPKFSRELSKQFLIYQMENIKILKLQIMILW